MDTSKDGDIEQLVEKFKAVTVNEPLTQTKSSARSLKTKGSWSNREEEWYFVNKRLLFATQSFEAADTWVAKLNELVSNDSNGEI